MAGKKLTPEQFERNMHKAAKEIAKPDDMLREIGFVAEAAAKREISSGPNRAIRSGAAMRDIRSRADSRHAYVGNSLNYPFHIHEGTKFMKARPYLQAGIERARPDIERVAARYGAKVLDKVGAG